METNYTPVQDSLEQGKPGLLSRITKVFTEPSAVFPFLTSKIDWLIPLIIVGILGGIIGHFVRPIFAKDMYPIMVEKYESYRQYMDQNQYDQMMAQIKQGFEEAEENPFKWYYPFIMVGFPFVVFLIISIIGLVSGNFVFGGKANFWIIMSAVAYAALIGLLGDLVRGAIVILKDSMFVYTGLGLLKPVDDGSFLHYLFRQIDIFSVWRVVVTGIGLGIVYKMKPKKFIYVLLSVWFVFIALVAVANMYTGGSLVY